MESFVVECREAGELARSRRAGQACTGYACAQQSGTRQEELSCRGSPCSCGFFVCWHETCTFKFQFFFNGNKKKFGYNEAKIGIQDEMKSCPTSYPMKKIACLQWRLDASCSRISCQGVKIFFSCIER